MGGRKQEVLPVRIGMFVIAITGIAVLSHLQYSGEADGVEVGSSSRLTGRHLLSTKNSPCEIVPAGDPTIFSYPVDAGGAGIILYIIGVMYMFVALAIVCDEFFVPALEELMEHAGVSDDVGGATFMAAGGSAPELFTSLIGTFQESSVGFGTIVGSAVFNVLFVIGMCAFFSKDLLKLTWWPLARDVCYYACGLVVLAIFFNDQSIELWEACVLFLGYWGYVFVMSQNEKLHNWFTKSKKPKAGDAKINPGETPGGPGVPGRRESNVFSMYENQLETKKISAFLHPRTFRDSVLQLWLTDKKVGVMDKVRYLLVSSSGNVDKTFDTIDADKSGFIDSTELKTLLSQLLPSCTDEDVQLALKEIDTSSDDRITKDEFKTWYKDSQLKLEGVRDMAMKEVKSIFDSIDKDSSGNIDKSEIEQLMIKVNHQFATDQSEKQGQLDVIWSEAEHKDPEKISFDEFKVWYKGSVAFQEHTERKIDEENQPDGGDEEEEGGLSLEWPSGLKAQLMFVLLLPLVGLLTLTVPDVRKPEKKKWYPMSFVLSILWIGVYSFFMVEWAAIIGDAIGIPPAVMGVTFLAAGTSIPDLMTSVIVARQGLGDMAVSSSIGSNIFDILVGLPVPWIIFSLTRGGEAVEVKAATIPVSILVLFVMLVCVIFTIMMNKWALTKGLGMCMFGLYGLFLIQDLLRACMPTNVLPMNFISKEECECFVG